MIRWPDWVKHVDRVVEKQGIWIGLCDGDGSPIVDIPRPAGAVDVTQWMAASSLSVTIPKHGSYGPNRVGALLMDEFVWQVDDSGRFIAANGADYCLGFAVPGKDGVRRSAGIITHVTEDEAGEYLTIHAESVQKIWESWPAPSYPLSWWLTQMEDYRTDESGVPYATPRTMSLVEMATVADGYTRRGPAEQTIREIVQESLDVVGSTQRDPDGTLWVDDPYVVMEVDSRFNTDSPEVLIRVNDGTLWEVLSGPAQAAGVLLGARVWWPGDPGFYLYEPVSSLADPDEVNLRTHIRMPHWDDSFQHAMVLLTAKQMKTGGES